MQEEENINGSSNSSSDRRSKEIKAELTTSILGMIKECEEEQNVDRKIEILYQINSIMPESERLKIPSLITSDFIDVALSRIEEKVLCWHFEKEVSGDDNSKYAVTS
jgi:hypothetical protein